MTTHDTSSELVSVSISGPDADWLADHARALVEAGLIACGNIVDGVRSIYRWEGATEDHGEALLLAHTTQARLEEVIDRTNAAHPNDTVQVIATAVLGSDPRYHQWVVDATSEG